MKALWIAVAVGQVIIMAALLLSLAGCETASYPGEPGLDGEDGAPGLPGEDGDPGATVVVKPSREWTSAPCDNWDASTSTWWAHVDLPGLSMDHVFGTQARIVHTVNHYHHENVTVLRDGTGVRLLVWCGVEHGLTADFLLP
jgi:hypothetical protein